MPPVKMASTWADFGEGNLLDSDMARECEVKKSALEEGALDKSSGRVRSAITLHTDLSKIDRQASQHLGQHLTEVFGSM